jgi:hypothetical protein
MKSVSFVVLAAVALSLPLDARQGSPWRPAFSNASALSEWTLEGTGTWQIEDGLLRLVKAGTPLPAGSLRRPAAIAVLKTPPLERVTVEAELRCLAPVDLTVRDMELIFGYESPTRFYYVHLSGVTNDVHNGVFLVDNADRRRIDSGKTPPQLTDQGWHHFRLDRDGATGRIQVFTDRSTTPAFDLTDRTIRAGRVGVGSFDDTGEVRGVVVTERK